MKNFRSIVFLTLITFFFNSNSAFAGPLCALAPSGHNPFADQNATQLAHQQMGAVNNFLCNKFSCPFYKFVQNQTIQNAMATRDNSGNTIRYNPKFMNDVIQKFGSFATIGILAHELGHIIDFHQNTGTINQAQREATADRYAGCAFALANHPQSDLIGLARSLHAMGPSPGYPTPSQRVQLILVGYQQCSH